MAASSMQQSVMGTLRSWTSGLRPQPVRRTRRELVADLVLWAALAVTVVSLDGQPVDRLQTDDVVMLAVLLLNLAVAVAVGRAAPHIAMLLSIVPVFVGFGRYSIAMMVTSYLAGSRMRRPRPSLVSYLVAVAVGTAAGPILSAGPVVWINVTNAFDEWLNAVMGVVFISVFPWLLGRSWRQYRELVQAGWERAELLEREQRMLVSQARLRERARIAHDMHDSLGHELSLIALRAGAFEVDPDLDGRHRGAAGELRATATDAAMRLREVIGVLRDDTDPVPLEPAGESITALVKRASAAGMPVTLEDADGAPPTLPPMADRAAYRVVQEGLTNATRHAPGAAVTVRLAAEPDQTVVTVTNRPPPGDPPADPPAGGPTGQGAGGHGLVGLRERVRLAGGTLDASPRAGGFELVARLPHSARPASGAPEDTPEDTAEDATARSESAARLEQERQRLRRRVVTAIAVPAALAVGLGSVIMTFYLANVLNSVLYPDDFARLQVGQARTELADVLPDEQLDDRPDIVELLPAPQGAECEYYGVDEDPLRFSGRDVHRLCFAGGRLVSKDYIPGDLSQQPPP